jgi:hypothetical protein
MNIFKTPSPSMSTPSEMERSMRPSDRPMPDEWPPQPSDCVKVAQSYDEAEQLLQSAAGGDMGARSIQHAERPRYGHKV